MQPLDLDFSTQRRPAGLGRWFTLLAGVAALAGTLAWNALVWQPRLAAAEKQLRAFQSSLTAQQPVLRKISDEQLAAEWRQAIAVAGALNQPWEKLFSMLEATTGGQVALLTLEPNAALRELVLTAEAKNFNAMLDFYRLLGQQADLTSVVLHSHQINQQDNDKPVRFRITATWGATRP
jgi:Tfp pilus assembly protein PilN